LTGPLARRLAAIGVVGQSCQSTLSFAGANETGMIDLGTLGGNFSNGTGVNNLGQDDLGFTS